MRRSDSVSLFVVSALPEAWPSQPLGRLSLALFVCSILLVWLRVLFWSCEDVCSWSDSVSFCLLFLLSLKLAHLRHWAGLLQLSLCVLFFFFLKIIISLHKKEKQSDLLFLSNYPSISRFDLSLLQASKCWWLTTYPYPPALLLLLLYRISFCIF